MSSATSRSLGCIALIGYLLIVVLLITMHAVRTDNDPFGQPLSEYVYGPHGWMMTSVFVALSLTGGVLLASLLLSVRPSPWLVTGSGFLAVAVVSELCLALFPGDPFIAGTGQRVLRTTTGQLHDVFVNLHVITLTVGVVLLPGALFKDPRWRACTALVAALAVLELVAFFTSTSYSRAWFGVGQRVWVASGLAWGIAVAYLMCRGGKFGGDAPEVHA